MALSSVNVRSIMAVVVLLALSLFTSDAFLPTTSVPMSRGAFRPTSLFSASSALSPTSSQMKLFSLTDDMVSQLEEMREKYIRLGNTVSAEADAERATMEDLMDKYNTYKEIRKLMKKLGNIWKNEASERRKAKQLKSFVELYNGRLEIEEILKEKMGKSSSKASAIPSIPELEEVLKWDAEIAKLEKKLEEVQIVIPTGMSTRDERFRS